MKAVLVGKDNNKVVAIYDSLVKYSARKGEVVFEDKKVGQATMGNVDFNIYDVKLLEGTTAPVIGDVIPVSLLKNANAFKDVSLEDYVETLQIEAADTLMQLSLARMDMNLSNVELSNTKMALAGATKAVTTATDEIMQVREEVAMLMMELTMKGVSL